MIHYNNDNNTYCSAVNAQNFETREHNTVYISTFLYTRNLYSYSHLEIFICIYSVRGEIDQISTNRLKIYNLLRSKCLHVCLHIDWSPYCLLKMFVRGLIVPPSPPLPHPPPILLGLVVASVCSLD